jgi:hypothetical protein
MAASRRPIHQLLDRLEGSIARAFAVALQFFDD